MPEAATTRTPVATGSGSSSSSKKLLTKQKRRFIALYFVIYPFLFLVYLIDLVISLFVSNEHLDKNLPGKDSLHSRLVDETDPSSAYRSTVGGGPGNLLRCEDPHDNLYKQLKSSCNRYFSSPTLGVRQLFSIDDEKQPNGKVFKKFSLGEYQWHTYEEVLDKVKYVSNGLLGLGLRSDAKVVLFAETRAEWIVSAFACFRVKAPVVTLYSTLGIDALKFGVNQTKSNYLITSADQLVKLSKILNDLGQITHIIAICDRHTKKKVIEFRKQVADAKSELQVFTLDEVEQKGRRMDSEECEKMFTEPMKDDLAVIMYTSGSTGSPKGVMISHANMLTSFQGLRSRIGQIEHNECYLSYLPLAHILELELHVSCLFLGIAVAYSSAQTMLDNSTAIKAGQKGDLRALKPTIVPCVPIILERINKSVSEKLSKTNYFKHALFKRAYEQKLRRFRRGASTRLLDRILFKSISRAVLGGRVRLIVTGGALLSRDVNEFTQVCFAPTIQAYGLTETCAAATTQLPNETTSDTCGSVVQCSEIRLRDWPEAGYRNTDRPNPRGEIIIAGDNIALGYYNMPEKTAEDFSVTKAGVRQFATGDIGEMLPNGNLKIIDRKKDLVKLAGGEYVSLNKLESLIKLMSFVENVCVVADPYKTFCVALVCPDLKRMKEIVKDDASVVDSASDLLAEKSAEKALAKLSALLDANPSVVGRLTKEIHQTLVEHNVDKFEIPTRIKIVKEIWLPDTGLVTDSLKLKRKALQAFYQDEIEKLYA